MLGVLAEINSYQNLSTIKNSSLLVLLLWSTTHIPPCRKFVFVFLFLWSLSSHSRIFHSYGDINIAGEGLQTLIYARHSWPLSSEGSLTSHNFCDMGLPFIMTRNTYTCCRAFGNGVVTTRFYDSGLSRPGI